MVTFQKFLKEICRALGADVYFNSHGEPRVTKAGRQVAWVQGNDEPGTKRADISDIVDCFGFSFTRCFLSDDKDGSFYVWDNLSDTDGQVLIYHGKSLKTALKRALAYNPFTDSKKFPLWN